MLRRDAGTLAEQVGFRLADEQAGGGARGDGGFRLRQQPAFPPVDPAHRLAGGVGVLPPLVAVQVDEIDDPPPPEAFRRSPRRAPWSLKRPPAPQSVAPRGFPRPSASAWSPGTTRRSAHRRSAARAGCRVSRSEGPAARSGSLRTGRAAPAHAGDPARHRRSSRDARGSGLPDGAAGARTGSCRPCRADRESGAPGTAGLPSVGSSAAHGAAQPIWRAITGPSRLATGSGSRFQVSTMTRNFGLSGLTLGNSRPFTRWNW